jgi:site-specific recombinase XerD
VTAATALVVEWCASLTDARRLSPNTVRAYAASLHRFVAFAGAHLGCGVDAAALSAFRLADFRAFLAHRRGDGLGNASIAREVAALRTFYAYAANAGVDASGLNGLASPKRAVRVPRPVAPADARALVADIGEAAREPWVAARDTAVVLLLYGAGLRIAEALALTGSALPLGATLVVTGKRAKTRIVPLLPVVRAAIETYAEHRTAAARPRCRAPASVSRRARPRMRCATASRRICSRAGPTCARSRNSSAMPACRRRRSIPRSMPRICSTSIATRTRALEAQAAIVRQRAAQARHASTHGSIPSRPAQLSAQASHTAAHRRQLAAWNSDDRSMKSAVVAQIAAQSAIRRKCLGATWSPPVSRQWFIAMPSAMPCARLHASMQAAKSVSTVAVCWCIAA